MVRLPLLLLSIVAFANADRIFDLFETFSRIAAHNANPDRTFNMGFHEIAALSPEEYKMRLGRRRSNVSYNTTQFHFNANFKAPDTLDWRDMGVVSPVKDQGNCGSCWAFSAVGALEGQHALKRGNLIQFSEQNLVDCDKSSGGCDGGDERFAFNYVKENGGIDTEESYPYDGRDETCHFDRQSVGETDEGFIQLPAGDEEMLKNVLASIGPLAIAIDCHNSMQLYKGGVYYEPKCSSEADDLNHAVLLVGYGTDPEHGDYWLVKNSWGAKFGEKGYIRIARNRGNNCGIATEVSYPIVH